MEPAQAKEILGLEGDASVEEVDAAYSSRSRVLKRRLVEASSVSERERFREALKGLMRVRDTALGPALAQARRDRRKRDANVLVEDWWSPQSGVPDRIRNREGALVFFGLGSDANEDAVRFIFNIRSRALKRQIAHARNDDEIHFFQHALERLNELLQFCLEPPAEPVATPEMDPEATRTDINPLVATPTSDTLPAPHRSTWDENAMDEPPSGMDEGLTAPKRKLSDSVFDLDVETVSREEDARPRNEGDS